MTIPARARQTMRGRLYEWRPPELPLDAEPERYWSVTTILRGGLPAPALMYWMGKTVAEYAVANYRQLYAMAGSSYVFSRDAEGVVVGAVQDPDGVQAAIDWLKNAPNRERDRKANVGTAVHEQAEAYVLGQPMPEPEPEVAGHVAAFRQFLTDWQPTYAHLDIDDKPPGYAGTIDIDDKLPGYWLAEASVFNRTESYAGTLDAIADLPGVGRVLIDYTTAKGVYPEKVLQLAMYRHAEFIGLPDGTEWPMPKVDGCAVLHIRADGYDLVPVITDEHVFKAALYVREVFRWQEETSKTVIGQPLPLPPRRAEVAA